MDMALCRENARAIRALQVTMAETVDFETSAPHSSRVILQTLRVDTPSTTISTSVAIKAMNMFDGRYEAIAVKI